MGNGEWRLLYKIGKLLQILIHGLISSLYLSFRLSTQIASVAQKL